MKYIILISLACFMAKTSFCQSKYSDKFSLNVYAGKSFLGYGDIWGFERKISIQYGKKYFISYDYGFADFEGAEFTEDYYINLSNSTLVNKHLNSILGNQKIKFFGVKSLDIRDNIININSHQINIGVNINLLSPRIQFGLHGTVGVFKLSRIGTDFIVKGVDLIDPNFIKKDVTVLGTFTHRFIDFSYGFGVELNYEVLKDRLKVGLFSSASLSSVRWFTIGLGTKINI
jgi:hypothetical protein